MRNFKLISNNNNNNNKPPDPPPARRTGKRAATEIVSYNPNGGGGVSQPRPRPRPQHVLPPPAPRTVPFSSLPFVLNTSRPHPPANPVTRRTPRFPGAPRLRGGGLSNHATASLPSGHFTPEPDPDTDIGTLSSKYSLDRRWASIHIYNIYTLSTQYLHNIQAGRGGENLPAQVPAPLLQGRVSV